MTRLFYAQSGVIFVLLFGFAALSVFFLVSHALALTASAGGCGCIVAEVPWWRWLLSVFSLGFLLFSGFHLMRLLRTQRKFHQGLSAQEAPLTAELRRAGGRYRASIRLISSEESEAFTTGFFRPRIVVSTALIEQLTREELEAVLAHEALHARFFHPFFSLVLMLGRAVFRIPQPILDYLRFLSEQEADRAALRVATVPVLARALIKVMQSQSVPVPETVPAFSSTNLRLQQLLKEPLRFSRTMLLGQSLLILSGIAAIVGVVALFMSAPEVYAASGGMCPGSAIPYCVRQTVQSIAPIQHYFPANASVVFTAY